MTVRFRIVLTIVWLGFQLVLPKAAIAATDQLPQVPSRYQLTLVGKDMVQDGMKMSAWYGRSDQSAATVLQEFRSLWESSGQAFVPGQAGDWQTLGYADGDYFVTIQARPSEAGHSEMVVSVLDTRTIGQADNSDFVRPPRARQLSILRSNDDGISNELTVFSDESSLLTVLDYYKLHLPDNGWQIQMITTEPDVMQPREYVIHIVKSNRTGQVVLSRQQTGETYITVNILEEF
jgi:hypothetical protein